MRVTGLLFSAVMLGSIQGYTYETCRLPPATGLTITKYYRKDCKHCQSIAPKIEEVISAIEKTGTQVTGAMIDTETCHEESKDIESIPAVVVARDGKQLLKFTGDRSYEDITKMVAQATGIHPSAFSGHKTDFTEIIQLTKDDFLSGFTGPWVIYFEDSYSKPVETILLETYRTFGGEIKVAKYVGADKEIVAGRYYIYDFPGILIMYDGILMRYNGDMTLAAFHAFCERLVAPGFKEITPEELQRIDAPTFVVFYSDVVLANRTFRRIAHDLKMNAQTYKMKIDTPDGENILKLAVFKNGSKFYYDGNINDEGAVREWLFHTHFPNLSKLSMDNFYSIFHGLKPVISIITDGGNTKEIAKFESIAFEHNRGSSSSPYVFVFIDKKEYPKFTEANFGVLRGKPLIVFFDPEKQMFYGEKIKPHEKIEAYFQRQVKQFEKNELRKYAREKPLSYKWLVGGVILVLGIAAVVKLGASKKSRHILE